MAQVQAGPDRKGRVGVAHATRNCALVTNLPFGGYAGCVERPVIAPGEMEVEPRPAALLQLLASDHDLYSRGIDAEGFGEARLRFSDS